MRNAKEIKSEILKLTRAYFGEASINNKGAYKSGERIHYAGRVYDENEMINLVDSALEFWLTSGRYTKLFEEKLADFLKVEFCHTCNSGSSANLLAFMSLTSELLGERSIRPGDEVITVAAGFPTTVAPIIQFGAIPVFLDVKIPQYNIDTSMLNNAVSEKTKAVMIAHTLGNPFDLKTVKDFCQKNNLWLIEDNCDALGAQYKLNGQWKYTGTIGDIGTSSFYPPHHITTGEGGAVYTDNPLLSKIILSLRDWGRDCSCPSGVDNLCGGRFERQFGELPFGYDHKYVYSHFGYNLKMTEMQSAIGVAQMDKLELFIKKRRNNWAFFSEQLKELSEYIILPEPSDNSKPSWFGFLMTVRKSEIFNRDELVRYLENENIQTRMLFAGNIVKQPCFNGIRKEKQKYRICDHLEHTDIIMNQSFWIGVYPELNEEKLNYMVSKIKRFFKKASGDK